MGFLRSQALVKFEKKHIGRLVADYDGFRDKWTLGIICSETSIFWYNEEEQPYVYDDGVTRYTRKLWLDNGRKLEKRANSSVG